MSITTPAAPATSSVRMAPPTLPGYAIPVSSQTSPGRASSSSSDAAGGAPTSVSTSAGDSESPVKRRRTESLTVRTAMPRERASARAASAAGVRPARRARTSATGRPERSASRSSAAPSRRVRLDIPWTVAARPVLGICECVAGSASREDEDGVVGARATSPFEAQIHERRNFTKAAARRDRARMRRMLTRSVRRRHRYELLLLAAERDGP